MNSHATGYMAGRDRGFSLLEMMMVLAILTIVSGIIVQGITATQARNVVESTKVDLTQESRQFMDQAVNDIHQAGFPSIRMFDPASLPSATCSNSDFSVACGLTSVSSTALQFEGDVDGSGVSEDWIQLVQTNGAGAAACTTPPCVIQRGTVNKQSWNGGAGTTPAYYTEVNNVMNTTIFTAYFFDGSTVTLPAAATDLPNIKSISMTLYVKSTQEDPQTLLYPTITMASTAKINN
jgi:prepilin-type N-terminal cleavage/methylation domain-containing protein